MKLMLLLAAAVLRVAHPTLPVHAFPDDPADSLYTAARAALAKQQYAKAADLFHDITSRFPSSTYASTAAYYEGFSRYRLGDTDNLRRAYQVLTASSPAPSADAPALATRVCAALVKKGDSSCKQHLDEAATMPTTCGDDDMRIAALDALLSVDSDRAMPILKSVLAKRDSCSVELRRKALFLVSQKGGSDNADVLLATAKNDPDADVRQQAVFWLSQVHDPRAVGMLDSLMRHSDDQTLREKAIFSLSQQRRSDMLRDFAGDASQPTELREKAMFWIGQSHDAGNQEWLRAQFGREKDSDLKEKILFDVSQQHDAGVGQWLMSVASDSSQSDEIRKKAVFWASQNHLVSTQELVALYNKVHDNEELADGLIFNFGQSHDAAALDELMAIAKNDKEQERRKKAVFWLGQSHDPRVVQFLTELITK